MHNPHADDWWSAMETEIQTLEVDLQSWTLVEREPWMKVVPVTWAFCLTWLAFAFVATCRCKGLISLRHGRPSSAEEQQRVFLGVHIERTYGSSSTNPTLTLTQEGLTKRIIESLGLCTSFSSKLDTPAEMSALPQYVGGTPASGSFNYAAVVGMLLYLAGHSRPEIAFAVHQCARYTFCLTVHHEQALKRIGRYLKGTMSKALIMTPSADLSIDCYPDADFADPHCARSHTGYVILVFGCPVLWKSKLQTEIALSTIEAEYVALSEACKDLLPIMDVSKELCVALGIPQSIFANIYIRIFEENVGALTLAGREPRHMTPRSKHYAIKYHWFHDQVAQHLIRLVKIATKDQLGDIFTKGLVHSSFAHLRSLLMGWYPFEGSRGTKRSSINYSTN
eukprot:CCRYP_013059-RB/>CCRYP_013059-RB protein AED:0.36 eAED:0.33 QI:0/0/0/0.75/0/0/4/0/393